MGGTKACLFRVYLRFSKKRIHDSLHYTRTSNFSIRSLNITTPRFNHDSGTERSSDDSYYNEGTLAKTGGESRNDKNKKVLNGQKNRLSSFFNYGQTTMCGES